MRQKNKQGKHGKFIEEQLEDLKQGQLVSVKTIEQEKDKFANTLNETLELFKDSEFKPDYFDEAFRKIDADRISTQIDVKEIDEEIGKEAEKESEESIHTKKEIITKNYNKVETGDTKVVETKQEKEKISFFDKLLQIL